MKARSFWLFLAVFASFQSLGAQRFQQGDTLTLWYRDAGQFSGYYQGTFLVDTVTQNFYLMSQQVPFPAGPLFGSIRQNFVGALIEGLPHFLVEDSQGVHIWYLDTTYVDPDLNLKQQLEGVEGFGYSWGSLLFAYKGVKIAKAPTATQGRWTSGSFFSFPEDVVRDLALAPRNPGAGRNDARLYVLQDHSIFMHTRPTRATWRLSLVDPDLYVDDHFEPIAPFADAGTFSDWTLVQGNATETAVYLNGKRVHGILADGGARFSKMFSLPVQNVPLRVDLSLALASTDAFWFEARKAGNEEWAVGVVNDTVKFRSGQEKDLGTLSLPPELREPVEIQMTFHPDTTDTSRVSVKIEVLVARRPVVSSQETLGIHQVRELDQVQFDVLTGRLFVDRVRVAPYFRMALGDVGTAADVYVLADGGVLFRYRTASGWEIIARGLPDVKFITNSPGAGALNFWAVSGDGDLLHIIAPDPSTVQIDTLHVSAGVSDIRDLAVSQTNPDSLLVATDAGVFVSGDGGQNWADLSDRMKLRDPISWVRDAKYVLWEGGDTAVVATYGGYYLTTDRFNTFKELDRTNFMRTERIEPSQDQIQEIATVLENAWQNVQDLVGGLASDVDGDPRIAVLLADVSHLPAKEGGRIPVFDVVDPALMDPESDYFDSLECFVLDVNFAEPIDPPHHSSSPIRGQTLPHPIRYSLLMPETEPDGPYGLDAILRALTRLVIYSHRTDEAPWVVEGIASVVEQAFRSGIAPEDPDTLLRFVGQIPVAFRIDRWTSAYFEVPGHPPLLRKFLYVFFKFLMGNYSLNLRDFVNAPDVTGKELVLQLTGEASFPDLYRTFLKKLARHELTLLPHVDLASFGTPYASRGADVLVGQIVPYGLTFARFDNNYEFTQVDTLRIDSMRFAIRVWDTLWVYGVVFRGVGDQVTLDTAFHLEVNVGRDTMLRPGLSLGDDTTAGPSAGDRAYLVLARFPENDLPAGAAIAMSDFAGPQVQGAGFVQDPLVDTRGFYYIFADEELYADLPEERDTLPAEGPLFLGVWRNPYGLLDTVAGHMQRVVSGVYHDWVAYQLPVSLLADQMDVTIAGEDRFGNLMDTLRDTLTLWSLRPGTAMVLTASGIRLEIPEGAVTREVRVYVQAMDKQMPGFGLLQGDALPGAVKIFQVGSASIRLHRPGRLIFDIPETVRDREIRVFHYTADGWQEIEVLRGREDQVELSTDHLGVFALVADGEGAVPTVFAFRLAHPVLKNGRSLAFNVAMPSSGNLHVDILDVLGRRVLGRTFRLDAGFHNLVVNARFAPGTYFVRVRAGDTRKVDRFVVVP